MTLRWVGKHLPVKFRFAHEYCFALHDELTGFVRQIERERLNAVTLQLRPEHMTEIGSLSGEALSDWLEDNGYNDTVNQMVFKACVHALLGDSCHYLYEALRCSEKEKLTVCFTLLRKPLRENLLYLEYLLYNPNKFLRAFWDHGPQHVAVETILARGHGPRIVAGAAARTLHPKLFDPMFVYQLRYDSSQAYSYDQLWTKAIHLVTTKRAAATESKNMNFIFSDLEAHLDQWEHLYATLPILLFHMVDVATSLLLFMGAEEPSTAESVLKRDLGLILWGREPRRNDRTLTRAKTAPLAFNCPGCGKLIPWAWTRYRAVYNGRQLTCSGCRRKWHLKAFLHEQFR